MEDAYFDVAFHGTLVEDCITIKNYDQEKTVVFDKSEAYGSTFDSIDSLKNSRYVNDVKVYKYEKSCLIEAFPMFLRPKGSLFKSICESNVNNFCEFITIDHHFLILENSKYYKIPYNQTQIVDTAYFSFKERHFVNKLIKGECTIDDLKNNLSDKTKRILFNGIVGDNVDYEACIKEYFASFGYKPFLFPKHGFRDLSEILSRSNAMCGTAYVLDKKIKVYSFSCDDEIDPQPSVSYNQSKLKNENAMVSEEIEIPCQIESGESDEDDSELIERFDNCRNATDEEENDISDEPSEESQHTGVINTIISADCCSSKRPNNISICFDPLGCDSNARECLSKENLYTSQETTVNNSVDIKRKGEKEKKYVLKNNTDILYMNEIITSGEEESICQTSLDTPTSEEINTVKLHEIKQEHSGFDTHQVENIINKSKEGYKYLISSSFGNLYAKELMTRRLKPSKTFVRVLNLKERLIEDRFFAYLYNGDSFIRILAINSSSMCCDEGTYVIYLLKKESKITENDLKILKIHACNVISDVSFQINEAS